MAAAKEGSQLGRHQFLPVVPHESNHVTVPYPQTSFQNGVGTFNLIGLKNMGTCVFTLFI